MANARDAADGSVRPAAQRGAQHLHNAPHREHHGHKGQRHIVQTIKPAEHGLGRQAGGLCEECQHQKQHGAQRKQVQMVHRQRGLAGKAVPLGEFPVEHAKGHGGDGVAKRGIDEFFHGVIPLSGPLAHFI